ncbi:HNH endonuclease [Bremerella volcania]|uniref:HNH endonuclease n=1 Tax=Bremerella volcania TaxID=2527984 RepID=A0A518C8I6_9BACT|nr:HNH endonuclease signature motif containing protein [Bremerella volcania]QDU75541.1 HNH endonuclease [Bremerella volcania]
MDAGLVQRVRQRANDVCEYCRMPQAVHLLTFPIDHVIARQHGGEMDLENLALSSVRCNSFKGPNIAGLDPESGELTRLFHPRTDIWEEHFEVRQAYIHGQTAVGRTTVVVLNMNHSDYVALRESIILEGRFPG